MHKALEFSARSVENGRDDHVPVCELLLHGTPTGKYVSGVVLEAAIQYRDMTLLFLTDDVPYEDMLSVHLVDKHCDVLDSAVIGAMYSSGSFSELVLFEPNTIHFRFIGNMDWTVEILPKASFRLPLLFEPRGVTRPFGFSRHFLVRAKPLSSEISDS